MDQRAHLNKKLRFCIMPYSTVLYVVVIVSVSRTGKPHKSREVPPRGLRCGRKPPKSANFDTIDGKMSALLLHRTSDSLLKMDIRAAHEWSRLKAACL
jgi:hypothetical protein